MNLHSGERSPTEPIVHEEQNQRRNSTDSDMIHYLYFEDNDGFFPPSWIGKESQQGHPTENMCGNDLEGPRDTSNSAYAYKGKT
ncbi:uncharacterized protein N7479_003276 [Penicillium vulpinum]|uniref:uncharacterized protein n=1 Tax=Penicillium vulpinum TaxID=29845 RepID=UPI00254967C8|nr:uncharacterized protein N7479_003276 [Penicillium vulpinum]KAJ5963400.1 hypothetical protein N7479_003276 [Penicillium vulpinum]